MASPSPCPAALQSKLLQIRKQIQDEHKQTEKDNLFNPLISPGPASIVLLNTQMTATNGLPNKKVNKLNSSDEETNDVQQEQEVPTSNNSNTQRGMFAAAALNAAVTRPLPLKRGGLKHHQQQQQLRSLSSNSASSTGSYNNDLTKVQWPVKNNYIVSNNDNVITCKCGTNTRVDPINLSRDDLLQCYHCHRWQHMKCYGLKNKLDILPTKYYCNNCKPGLSSESYKINKKTKLLQKQQKEKISNLNLQIQMQIQKQLKLNILNNKINKNKSDSTDDKDSSQVSPESHSPLNSDDRCSPSQSPPLLSADLIKSRLIKEASQGAFETYQYRDKYIKLFVEDHSNDDWVIQINRNLDISPYSIETKLIDEKTKGVFAKTPFANKSYIMEFPGMIDFQKNYIADPDNQYRIWATTQPEVTFHPHWPILIDARAVDDTDPKHCIKYIRRSCYPNVVMSTIKIRSQITNKMEVYFMINAIRDIKVGEELLIGWQWDLRHPISRVLNDRNAVEHMNDMDKLWLIHAIDIIWQTCQCGCSDDSRCMLLQIKKYADSFLSGLKQKKKHVNV